MGNWQGVGRQREAGPTTGQREAIESWQRGDVCVVAGPGSGKTFVLVERFKWLVQQRGVPTHRILAITFTNKAADNMRRRLIESFPAGSGERRALERAYISTIDAFCSRLLRENAIEAGLDPEFRVLDEWEADFQLRQAVEETLEQEYRARPARPRKFLAQFGGDDLHGSLFDLYQAVRAAGTSVEEAGRIGSQSDFHAEWQRLVRAYEQVASLSVRGWSLKQRLSIEDALAIRPKLAELAAQPAGPEHLRALGSISFHLGGFRTGSSQREAFRLIREQLKPACRAALLLELNQTGRRWLLEMLAEVDRRYRRAKSQAGTLDYADLEERLVRLLDASERPPTRDFSFTVMDEFQDTNPLQARLVRLLRSEGSFFAVGDINQSIYGFRHADPTVFQGFRGEVQRQGGHEVVLEENFRSRQELLDAIGQIMRDAQGIEPRPLRSAKSFAPSAEPCLEILSVQAEDADEALKLEARHVVARILELVPTRAGYRDFVVLLKTTAQVRIFERVMRQRGVPCQVHEGRGFYEAREIRDLLAFLRVLLNPLDEISLAAVLRSSLAGVTDDTLLRLKLASPSLIEAIDGAQELPAEEAERLDRFRGLLDRYRAERDYLTIDRLLARLLAETGYEAWLLEQPGGTHMAANVRKFLVLARRFHHAGSAGLEGFLRRVEDFEREEAREAEAQPADEAADAVQLMTVHAAKGLEFPVVFLPAINRPTRRDSGSIRFAPGIGIGMRWKDSETGKSQPDAVAEAIARERESNRREETHRLFYVAMTRAEELLVLSASFGSQVRNEHWAALVAGNLGLDWSRIDNQPRLVQRGDFRYRLLQTNQEPAASPPPAARALDAAPAVLRERPRFEDQSDVAVSVTSVALFAQCPRKYYLSRYLGFDRSQQTLGEAEDAAAPEPDEMDASEFGRHVHELLAGALPPAQGSEEALALVANFHHSPLGQAAAAARAERERSFLFALDGRLVRGQIDLWFESGGEVIVVDYKTDQVTEQDAAARAAEYELQLRLYALAVERITGARPGRAIVYFLRPNVPVEVSLASAALEAAKAKVAALFEAQSRLSFPLREGEHCRRCPHFGGQCPATLA